MQALVGSRFEPHGKKEERDHRSFKIIRCQQILQPVFPQPHRPDVSNRPVMPWNPINLHTCAMPVRMIHCHQGNCCTQGKILRLRCAPNYRKDYYHDKNRKRNELLHTIANLYGVFCSLDRQEAQWFNPPL